MAMRTATPWWLSVVMAVGLFFVFLGERAFSHAGGAATVLTYLGAALLVSTAALRGLGFARSTGKRRKAELVLLVCQLGVLVALAIYAFSPDYAADAADAKDAMRSQTMVTVVWVILLVASLAPLVMAEVSLGIANRGAFDLEGKGSDASVDSYRVSAMAGSGLSIALGLAFLMVTCEISDQRNMRADVSYFRTSTAGSKSVNIVKHMKSPLKVLLFFPDPNEVAAEVRGYFETLRDQTGKVIIEEHDRMISSDLAEKYKVVKDGTVVLVRELEGEAPPPPPAEGQPPAEDTTTKSDIFTIDTDLKKAQRNQLRTLDETVQKSLHKVVRDRRVAYMTVGHGEINDPDSAGPLRAKAGEQAQIIKTILGRLNYQVKPLARNELMGAVPDDADVVLVMGPVAPLMDGELEALDRYLAQGGSLLLALDPQRKGDLGMLSGRLGVTWDGVPLADDSQPLRMSRGLANNMVIAATEFSSHASVTTLARVGAREGGLPFVITGSLEEAPFERMADETKKPKRTFVVTSPKNAFRDHNKDFRFTSDSEKRQAYNLVAAIEDPAAVGNTDGAKPNVDKIGMRAMVWPDVELFVDQIQGRAIIAQVAFADAIGWLGGEEIYAGETVSEKDVRIKHTRDRDAKWFYGSILGAPLFILGIGLVVMGAGRRGRRRRAEARSEEEKKSS